MVYKEAALLVTIQHNSFYQNVNLVILVDLRDFSFLFLNKKSHEINVSFTVVVVVVGGDKSSRWQCVYHS